MKYMINTQLLRIHITIINVRFRWHILLYILYKSTFLFYIW